MDWLSIVASWASIVGLLVSAYTLRQVRSLASHLKRRSRVNKLTTLINKFEDLPTTKRVLTESDAHSVKTLIGTIRFYDLPRWAFQRRELRYLLQTVETEVQGARSREAVLQHLRLIREELTVQ